MASVAYYREQFAKCQTDEERQVFCYRIMDTEFWSRPDRDDLPDGFLKRVCDYLRAAMEAEGQVALFDRFVEVIRQFRNGEL